MIRRIIELWISFQTEYPEQAAYLEQFYLDHYADYSFYAAMTADFVSVVLSLMVIALFIYVTHDRITSGKPIITPLTIELYHLITDFIRRRWWQIILFLGTLITIIVKICIAFNNYFDQFPDP